MIDMSRATYHSPRRKQAAAATREAILDAAGELFATQGYSRTTVAQIAEAAQVAANTVYTSVGGKPQLLGAIMDDGSGDPAAAETLAAVAQSTDPAEVIRCTASGVRRVNERHAQGIAVLLESAKVDPAAAKIYRVGLRRFRQALDRCAGRLEDLGALEPSEREHASDVFWYFFGFMSWQTLIGDLGWSWDEAEQWLAQQGIDALLKPRSRRR
jgi:AcrR family transcriptional regulator